MQLGLDRKRALVTGASTGLGAAVALALMAEGAQVVINSRDPEKLEASANLIEQATGHRPFLAVGDVSVEAERASVIQSARGQVQDGMIDILVANTGGPPAGAFLDLPDDAWDKAGQLLLGTAVGLTRALLPDMVKQKWGRLIYVTSIAVLQPVDDLILSNSYRAGVTGFCKTIANTYGKYGITANTVCPGYTATDRLTSLINKRAETAGMTNQEVTMAMTNEIPGGRLGQPDELAALVAFLSSDKAAYINGTSIPVDGGLHRSLL